MASSFSNRHQLVRVFFLQKPDPWSPVIVDGRGSRAPPASSGPHAERHPQVEGRLPALQTGTQGRVLGCPCGSCGSHVTTCGRRAREGLGPHGLEIEPPQLCQAPPCPMCPEATPPSWDGRDKAGGALGHSGCRASGLCGSGGACLPGVPMGSVALEKAEGRAGFPKCC